MININMLEKKIHQGRNIKRFREMLGIKQEVLAYELGDDWNQKKISLLEQKELIENDILDQVAKILKVPADAIKNFDEEQAINIISNTASFDNCQQPAFFNNQPTFNPLDKMVELYERMLEQQKEMIDRLEKLIREK
ncbi:helix-turn-helix domain-containing protein [Flavobacterium sp. LC2016-23]|uniref:helix-turn-helix domain-containing protein n=1 Tax=Flavobacterium sp. LC2016-23 TaxID=2666330 RepID=UPI0012AF4A14|nr:helix-turn-helix transcriptional regulator [Flavobacterium sp. LC2016-23]MRX40000.1 helix-turn-helix domain-containing protein [Flavobacterium sp. LC2016-23]